MRSFQLNNSRRTYPSWRGYNKRMDLTKITRIILIANEEPISIVRLPRVIYFIHKYLIKLKVMKAEDIKYTRRPLGPAPKELSKILANHKYFKVEDFDSPLSYNKHSYSIVKVRSFLPYRKPKDDHELPIINELITKLRTISTSSLVDLAQSEPSWLGHSNGEEYYITDLDLESNSLEKLKINWTGESANLLQAKLIRGMLEDIVKESTDLEYPNE